MEQLTNAAEVIASPTSSPTDFDFLVGAWRIHNLKLKTRLNGCNDWMEFEGQGECRKILTGCGTLDDFRATVDGELLEAITLRLFNPKTGLWTIYWAASNVLILDVPVVGSFEGNIGRFYANDVFERREIIVQFQWDKTNPNAPTWRQAFSADNGTSWEWNWHMAFHKQH